MALPPLATNRNLAWAGQESCSFFADKVRVKLDFS